MKLIDKTTVVAKIKERIENCAKQKEEMLNAQCYTLADDASARMGELNCIQDFIDTLEVIDPYELCVQYPSVKDAIQAHAETYSFNIESKLFNQLTKEQQKLWRKEIEQACISGGDAGYLLAKDIRYKENLEIKEVDFEKEIDKFYGMYRKDGQTFSLEDNEECLDWKEGCNPEFEKWFARHFFELGIKSTKGE